MSDFTGSPQDVEVRRLVLKIDRKTLGESKRIFTISRNVANRLERFNGLEGTPLYPPLRAGLNLDPGPYGDYIFSMNRLDAAKRIDLLLDSLAKAPGVRAIIAGTGPDAEALKRRSGKLGISDRVRFEGYVSDERASELYTNARAVYFSPVDEDYGYGAVEALHAARPVVTADDSGGVLEFVEDEVTGLVTPADPTAIARSISRLMSDPDLAARLGIAGRGRVFGITWDKVVDSLLGSL
jgi:glycosyltransferase involved in cell wall biosynthesis